MLSKVLFWYYMLNQLENDKSRLKRKFFMAHLLFLIFWEIGHEMSLQSLSTCPYNPIYFQISRKKFAFIY